MSPFHFFYLSANRVNKVPLALVEMTVFQEPMAPQDLLEHRALMAEKAVKVTLDPLDPLEAL